MPDRGPADIAAQSKRLNRIVILLIGAAAILLAIAVIAAALSAKRINDDTRWVEHTLEARAAIYTVGNFAERVETARRGFFIAGDPRFADAVRRSHAQMRQSLTNLTRLTADSPEQLQRTERIRTLSDRKWALVTELLNDRAGWLAQNRSADLYNDQTVQLIRQIRRTLEAMDAREVQLLAQRTEAQQSSLRQFAILGSICVLFLVILVGSAGVLIARYNADLTRTQAGLQLANEGLEDAVTARTAELSRANAEIQRFAYIVSHDLRSPLVNVLGFTAELDAARKTLHAYLTNLYDERPELKDQAAWLAVEEDLPEALDFIRTSTEKMDRLINSILELSRQGRRQLRPETLDMGQLAENVAATLRQRADAAGATVSIGTMPPVTSDRMAVEQILSNLVENALKYLSPARRGEVRIEGRKVGAWLEYDVIDNGRGIAPTDHERIFDLFRRAGAQDQAGEGIGLANVRALAYRLGGRVSVESQLDQGACFTLALPEKFVAAEPSA